MPSWILLVLRALGIRSVADVVPVATEIAETVRDVVDPPEPGQPLPYTAVRDIQRQIESATSHKVPPPIKPRTGNPARVVAASAPAAGAVREAPGAGAEGTRGRADVCRVCGGPTVPWEPLPDAHRWCSSCGEARPVARSACTRAPVEWQCTRERGHVGPCAAVPLTPGPGLAKAVDRTKITPPLARNKRPAPPRPTRKEPDK